MVPRYRMRLDKTNNINNKGSAKIDAPFYMPSLWVLCELIILHAFRVARVDPLHFVVE